MPGAAARAVAAHWPVAGRSSPVWTPANARSANNQRASGRLDQRPISHSMAVTRCITYAVAPVRGMELTETSDRE